MRLLTKAEACRELAVSLSTLDRRIASGELMTRREPRGRRHRVYVMLDDDPPVSTEAPDSAMAVAQERTRGWEEQVELLHEQLLAERNRNAALVEESKTGRTSSRQDRQRPWWRPWQPNGR